MQQLEDWVLSVTYIFLTASILLIGSSLLGLGGDGPVLGVLLALGAVLAATRQNLENAPPLFGYRVGRFARDLWLGPVIAVALVFLIKPGASAAELQAIGGIAGFLGMLNYFIRPLYFLGIRLGRRVVPSD